MDVNVISNVSSAYTAYESTSTKKADTTDSETVATTDNGVIYEPSTDSDSASSTSKATNANIIAQLQADAEERTAQLRSIVEKLITGQGNAIGTSDDIWSFLRSGNFTVDAETKAQAEADIAEDGYYGVTQTSDRILDFAKALCGNDPDAIEEMREAFKKGFEQATETWGDTLPDISQKTYDAVMQKFDEWAEEAASTNA